MSKRKLKRIELVEGVFLEGIGALTSPVPMHTKHVELEMFYDFKTPLIVTLKCKGLEHFIPLSNIKDATFENDGCTEQ